MELIFNSHRNVFNYVDSQGMSRRATVNEFLNTLANRNKEFKMEIRRIDGKIHIFVKERQESSYSPPKRFADSVQNEYNETKESEEEYDETKESEEESEEVSYSPNQDTEVRRGQIITFY